MPLLVRNFTRHSQKNLSQIVFMSYVSLSLTYLCTWEKWRNQRNKTVARSGSPTIEPSLDLKLCWCCSGVEWVAGLVALWVNSRDFQGECFIGGILDNQWVRCFSDDRRWVFFFFALMKATIYFVARLIMVMVWQKTRWLIFVFGLGKQIWWWWWLYLDLTLSGIWLWWGWWWLCLCLVLCCLQWWCAVVARCCVVVVVYMLKGKRKNNYLNEIKNRVSSLMCP